MRYLNLHQNFFVQALAPYDKIEDVWKEQLFLAKYGNVRIDESAKMSHYQRRGMMDIVQEWVKKERKEDVEMEKAKLKAQARIFQGRR